MRLRRGFGATCAAACAMPDGAPAPWRPAPALTALFSLASPVNPPQSACLASPCMLVCAARSAG
eukprot:CAMPEP_0202097988 /NCGR_PEP_ID=MMETSP0965-20130614/1497_1 /ASSEMBLY_ACC=CAM_ASM_000507 /TAXON_ID=4773 /ORGANISM="Schizochytrium aggregatum, Strain ATCC28209" /LENGTH=63 /DNA_ID=CAMNT_0048666383 /DNA_START=144 /DNA_END=331 /DNA_ORIENTATION=-